MTSSLDIAAVLGRCVLFAGLPPEPRQKLAALCKPVSLAKGDCLFLEGRPANAMYVLASGSIQLLKTSAAGSGIVIKTVEPGEVFAEVVLMERDRYPVTALALKKSTVYQLLRQDFRSLLSQEAFRDGFILHLSKRLRYLTDRILSLTTDDVEHRFFRFLREQYGDRREYSVPMSKKDIAAAMGTTPETLSRLVARMTKDRKIAWKDKTVRILRRDVSQPDVD